MSYSPQSGFLLLGLTFLFDEQFSCCTGNHHSSWLVVHTQTFASYFHIHRAFLPFQKPKVCFPHTIMNFIMNKLCTIATVIPSRLCTPVFVDFFFKHGMTCFIQYITILLAICFLSILSKYTFETVLYSRKFVGVAYVQTF